MLAIPEGTMLGCPLGYCDGIVAAVKLVGARVGENTTITGGPEPCQSSSQLLLLFPLLLLPVDFDDLLVDLVPLPLFPHELSHVVGL
jgi:hypothetical protein